MRAMPTARRRLLALTAAVFIVAAIAAIGAEATSANPVNGSDANGTYLALGDSVAFGYVPPQAFPRRSTSMRIRSSATRVPRPATEGARHQRVVSG